MPKTVPHKIWVEVPGAPEGLCRLMGHNAQTYARQDMPKLSGAAAGGTRPFSAPGVFGLTWRADYLWYQEAGIKAFTMKSLQGKTIPMWVDDPTGSERQKNKGAKTRVTASGKTQVLIFRKATKPGVPGRIGRREAGRPLTTPGKLGGAIASGNVGVKWRHPGLSPRGFLHKAVLAAAHDHGLNPEKVWVA